MNLLLKGVTLVMIILLKVLAEMCHSCHEFALEGCLSCHDYLVEGIDKDVSFLS